MKLIEPSYEIITQKCNNLDTLVDDMCKHIELCGRVCYKSEDKITEDSAKDFVQRMISSKHYAMLEHGTIYLVMPITKIKQYVRYLRNKYSYVNIAYGAAYITTNYRVVIENNWENDLSYIYIPTEYHIKRYTVKFITDIGVSREFLRHRIFSFANESTRFCNYSKDRFSNEITFIKPLWCKDNVYCNQFIFEGALEAIEENYLYLINNQHKPQDARAVLPLCTKSELIMTGFSYDWNHFFKLRALGTTGAPHPEAKRLAEPLMREFIDKDYTNQNLDGNLKI